MPSPSKSEGEGALKASGAVNIEKMISKMNMTK
jgi:hypothetical protein